MFHTDAQPLRHYPDAQLDGRLCNGTTCYATGGLGGLICASTAITHAMDSGRGGRGFEWIDSASVHQDHLYAVAQWTDQL